jgi:hypothetical protein
MPGGARCGGWFEWFHGRHEIMIVLSAVKMDKKTLASFLGGLFLIPALVYGMVAMSSHMGGEVAFLAILYLIILGLVAATGCALFMAAGRPSGVAGIVVGGVLLVAAFFSYHAHQRHKTEVASRTTYPSRVVPSSIRPAKDLVLRNAGVSFGTAENFLNGLIRKIYVIDLEKIEDSSPNVLAWKIRSSYSLGIGENCEGRRTKFRNEFRDSGRGDACILEEEYRIPVPLKILSREALVIDYGERSRRPFTYPKQSAVVYSLQNDRVEELLRWESSWMMTDGREIHGPEFKFDDLLHAIYKPKVN